MRLAYIVLGTAIGVLLVACGGTPTPTPTPAPTVRFRIVADGTTMPLLRSLADAYSANRPNVIIMLESGNPAFVADQVLSGQAQLGATSLLPSGPADAKTKPWLADLAYDGIAVIVQAQNPISDLSLPDVRAIFSGERNHWRDYGAEDIGPIDVAVREGGDGTRVLFDQTVMGAQKLTLDALVMPSIETMINFVAIKPGGIGYAPTASVSRQNNIVKTVMISGKAPTPEAILSGEYPLVRTLNLIAPREPQGPLREFVVWALGPEGRRITQSLGYVVAQ